MFTFRSLGRLLPITALSMMSSVYAAFDTFASLWVDWHASMKAGQVQ